MNKYEIYKILLEIKRLNIGEYLTVKHYISKTRKKVLFNAEFLNKINLLENEFITIYNFEKKIINLLFKVADKLNYDEFIRIIDEIDKTNDKSISYLYDVMDDIELGYELNQFWRGNLYKTSFEPIYKNQELLFKIYCSLLSFDDVLDIMDFPEEFKNYLKNNVDIMRVDSNDEEQKWFFGVYPLTDSNNVVLKLKIIIPYIINEYTFFVTVHELKHAYDLFLLNKQSISDDLSQYEDLAKKEEERIKTRLLSHEFKVWKDNNKL